MCQLTTKISASYFRVTNKSRRERERERSRECQHNLTVLEKTLLSSFSFFMLSCCYCYCFELNEWIFSPKNNNSRLQKEPESVGVST